MSKLRDALEGASATLKEIRDAFRNGSGGPRMWEVNDVINEAEAALAEPLRNCDVGTAEEQSIRMAKFCSEQFKKTDGTALCSGCQFHNMKGLDCQFAWSQMPYKSDDSDDLIIKNEDVKNGD